MSVVTRRIAFTVGLDDKLAADWAPAVGQKTCNFEG